MPLQKGEQAPKFEAQDQNGNVVRLSDFEGQKLVLYFYPKDSTPTCTTQACNLRDNYEWMQKQGYVVLGVSTDDAKSHQKFIQKHSLPFSLLTDTEHILVNLYGVWDEKMLYGKKYMGTIRTTFVIDEKGIIQDIIKKVESKNHAAQVLGS